MALVQSLTLLLLLTSAWCSEEAKEHMCHRTPESEKLYDKCMTQANPECALEHLHSKPICHSREVQTQTKHCFARNIGILTAEGGYNNEIMTTFFNSPMFEKVHDEVKDVQKDCTQNKNNESEGEEIVLCLMDNVFEICKYFGEDPHWLKPKSNNEGN